MSWKQKQFKLVVLRVRRLGPNLGRSQKLIPIIITNNQSDEIFYHENITVNIVIFKNGYENNFRIKHYSKKRLEEEKFYLMKVFLKSRL